jgi:hypothetical protein
MATWQPLGAGGGGDPHRPTPQDKVEEAVADHQQAIIEAGTLFDELRRTPGVATVAMELENRIIQLLQGDAYAASLLRIIERWRHIIEGAPKAAEDKVRRLLGPVLVDIKDETQAAP